MLCFVNVKLAHMIDFNRLLVYISMKQFFNAPPFFCAICYIVFSLFEIVNLWKPAWMLKAAHCWKLNFYYTQIVMCHAPLYFQFLFMFLL